MRRQRHAPAEKPADAMREADRLLQAMLEQDPEADLALYALCVVGDEPARLVISGLVPVVPRGAGSALDVDREHRVLTDDPRPETQDLEPGDGTEPLPVTE